MGDHIQELTNNVAILQDSYFPGILKSADKNRFQGISGRSIELKLQRK